MPSGIACPNPKKRHKKRSAKGEKGAAEQTQKAPRPSTTPVYPLFNPTPSSLVCLSVFTFVLALEKYPTIWAPLSSHSQRT